MADGVAFVIGRPLCPFATRVELRLCYPDGQCAYLYDLAIHEVAEVAVCLAAPFDNLYLSALCSAPVVAELSSFDFYGIRAAGYLVALYARYNDAVVCGIHLAVEEVSAELINKAYSDALARREREGLACAVFHSTEWNAEAEVIASRDFLCCFHVVMRLFCSMGRVR